MLSYIVCSTPRTGTHLLSGLMEAVQVGRPREHFLASYTHRRQLIRAGMLNDVWGSDLKRNHWNNAIYTLKYLLGRDNLRDYDLLNSMFPGVKFIYLYRINKLKQAISMVKAIQTGRFQSEKQLYGYHYEFDDRVKGLHKLAYSSQLIQRAVLNFMQEEAEWFEFFESNSIKPHYLAYETLCQNKRVSISNVLKFLGVSYTIDRIYRKVKHARLPTIQYDSVNHEWYQRYLRDNAITGFYDYEKRNK